MNTDQEIATNMLRRLLAGERGALPMHLAILLERSSPLANTDSHYKQVLPPELVDVRLTATTAKEIIDGLCLEISRNPDEAVIAAVSTTGSEAVTKLVTEVLMSSPRPLTSGEYRQVLGIAYAYLPSYLDRNQHFLQGENRTRLINQLRSLAENPDVTIRRPAGLLLERLLQKTA